LDVEVYESKTTLQHPTYVIKLKGGAKGLLFRMKEIEGRLMNYPKGYFAKAVFSESKKKSILQAEGEIRPDETGKDAPSFWIGWDAIKNRLHQIKEAK